jgi:hypothetical protein
MKVELKTITPAIAQKMLKMNIGNRALTIWHVEELAKEIRAGRWRVNGDMIRISITGRVLDGQHRLAAIVKTKMTIQTWVMEGLEDDIFDTIDVGKKRSQGDTLGCLGEKNAYRLSSALILIDKYCTGRVQNNISYSNGEVEELLEKYPGARDSIQTKCKTKLILPSVLDACHFLFSSKDAKLTGEFVEKVLRGAGLEEGDPWYVLRERLVANSLAKAKLNKAYIFALCIKAWNHARVGKKIQHLKLNERDGKLVEFPVVQ